MRTDRLRNAWIIAPVMCAALIVPVGPVLAIESLSFQIERVDTDQWSARAVGLQITLGPDNRIDASLSVDELSFPEPIGRLRDIRLNCRGLELYETEYRCTRTEARVGDSPLDDLPFTGNIRYRPKTDTITFSSTDLPLMGYRVAVDAQWQSGGWSAQMQARSIEASALYEHLHRLIESLPDTEIGAGIVSVVTSVAADDTGRMSLDATLDIDDLAISNESGTLASDSLAAQVEITTEALSGSDRHEYLLTMTTDRGEAYIEPVYFDFKAAPLTVRSTGDIDTEARTLSVSELDYQHLGTIEARGVAQLRWGAATTIDVASVTIDQLSFPSAYRTYLQGFLVGTPLASLQTSGNLHGNFDVVDDSLRAVDMTIDDVNADDTGGRLAIYRAKGDIRWRSDGQASTPRSRIEWAGGFVYTIGYGAGSLALTLVDDDISLIDSLRVPILDGALVIDTFDARGLQSDAPEIDFEARLEPIELRRLTPALGWPAFAGTLSGELPRLSLRDNVLALGGRLEARVFDGTVRISSLRVEEPFAANRRGSANIELDNLDLGLITEVFTLGRITGRLDGTIKDLQTVKNQPVAFDARLYTPPGDDSRHRISRRAINNLSEIAGSGGALLSSGALRFFEEFSYSSLGISCRLEGDVCEMAGVNPATSGYYLVKGRGLPRIDVIGHSREVNWPRLVAQIEKALKSTDATTGKTIGSQ